MAQGSPFFGRMSCPMFQFHFPPLTLRVHQQRKNHSSSMPSFIALLTWEEEEGIHSRVHTLKQGHLYRVDSNEHFSGGQDKSKLNRGCVQFCFTVRKTTKSSLVCPGPQDSLWKSYLSSSGHLPTFLLNKPLEYDRLRHWKLDLKFQGSRGSQQLPIFPNTILSWLNVPQFTEFQNSQREESDPKCPLDSISEMIFKTFGPVFKAVNVSSTFHLPFYTPLLTH